MSRINFLVSLKLIPFFPTIRLQNLEMDRIRGDRDKREAYIRTLERARDSATRAFEDVSLVFLVSSLDYS